MSSGCNVRLPVYRQTDRQTERQTETDNKNPSGASYLPHPRLHSDPVIILVRLLMALGHPTHAALITGGNQTIVPPPLSRLTLAGTLHVCGTREGVHVLTHSMKSACRYVM